MRSVQRGFTLIELMAVVAILAILAAIAIPSYYEQVRKSRRSDAKVALEKTAQQLERCYAQNNTFVYDATSAPSCPQNFTTNGGYYTISVAATPTSYKLSAQPTVKGGQNKDADCSNFILDSSGSKTSKDGSGLVNNHCW
jgi:type IV pilus assembly protein PilE